VPRLRDKAELTMLWAKIVVEAKTTLETIESFGSSQWTAVFAAALTLTSFVQALFILRANKVARDAANAAKKTADSLQMTERAYVAEQIVSKADLHDELLLHSGSLSRDESEPAQASAQLIVAIRFTNFGKTPATLKSWAASLSIDGAVRKVDLEPHLFAIRILGPGEQSGDYGSPSISTPPPAEGQRKKLKDGSMHLWVTGYVDFEDIFGKATKREFVWRYDVTMRRFIPHYFRIVEEN
jgi:hypothetical protein